MYRCKIDMRDMYVWIRDYGKNGARGPVRIVLGLIVYDYSGRRWGRYRRHLLYGCFVER